MKQMNVAIILLASSSFLCCGLDWVGWYIDVLSFSSTPPFKPFLNIHCGPFVKKMVPFLELSFGQFVVAYVISEESQIAFTQYITSMWNNWCIYIVKCRYSHFIKHESSVKKYKFTLYIVVLYRIGVILIQNNAD